MKMLWESVKSLAEVEIENINNSPLIACNIKQGYQISYA